MRMLYAADSFKSPKCDSKFQHFAVIIRNVTAKCWKLQQLSKCDRNIPKSVITWLQLLKYDCKIRKVTAKFTNMMVNYKKTTAIFKKNAITWMGFLVKFDSNFQHFAVTFLILQSDMDYWNWWRGIECWYIYILWVYLYNTRYKNNCSIDAISICVNKKYLLL